MKRDYKPAPKLRQRGGALAPHPVHTHTGASPAFSPYPGCRRFPFLIWFHEDRDGLEVKSSEELGMVHKIRSPDLGFVSKVSFTSCMTLGKSVKVFQGKVHSSQTRAHLKVLMNQESHPQKLFSAELAEINTPISNITSITSRLLWEFWLPYFHSNCEFISTVTHSFVSWALMLMYLVSHSLTTPKITRKEKSHVFFLNMG